jgi:multidrug resistance efflux pump
LTGISAAKAEPAHAMVATAIASVAEADSELLLTDIKPPSVGNVSYLT